jgi:hypothetical protein
MVECVIFQLSVQDFSGNGHVLIEIAFPPLGLVFKEFQSLPPSKELVDRCAHRCNDQLSIDTCLTVIEP